MNTTTERFKPSEVTLQLPAGTAASATLGGLTGPQMRLALVLVAIAGRNGGRVVVEKPRLEEMTGIVLDSANRLLEPVRHAVVELPGHDADGDLVFDSIIYRPGKKGSSVGVIAAQLSIGMGHVLGDGGSLTMPLQADELRQYGSVAAILLRLRLGAALVHDKTAKLIKLRIRPDDLACIFGSYARVATVRTASTVTGEITEHTALSRAGAVLIYPAVETIADVSDAMSVKSSVRMDGRKWSTITVEARRLTTRKTAPKPPATKGKFAVPRRPGVAPDKQIPSNR